MSLAGFDANGRDQWHSQITHSPEQSMQGGLIDHRAGQERVAVVFQRDRQAPEPVRPLATKVALDPDLIDHWFTRIRCRVACV
jgi:hypothetical protein